MSIKVLLVLLGFCTLFNAIVAMIVMHHDEHKEMCNNGWASLALFLAADLGAPAAWVFEVVFLHKFTEMKPCVRVCLEALLIVLPVVGMWVIMNLVTCTKPHERLITNLSFGIPYGIMVLCVLLQTAAQCFHAPGRANVVVPKV